MYDYLTSDEKKGKIKKGATPTKHDITCFFPGVDNWDNPIIDQ